MSRRERRQQQRLRRPRRDGRGRRRILLGAGVTVAAAFGITASAEAADFTVNSLTDSGDGTCDAAAGGCTLRDALDDAAANDNRPIVDRILFDSRASPAPPARSP